MAKKEFSRSDLTYFLQTVKQSLFPHRKQVLTLISFSIMVAGTDAFVPLLAGKIFDALIAISRGTSIIITGIFSFIIIWIVLKITSDVMSWRISTETDRLGTQVYSEYIASGFSSLLFLPIQFHKNQKQGTLGEKINRAANSIDIVISRVLIRVVPEMLTIILALALAFFIEPTLTIILVIAIPIYILILKFSVSGLALLQRKVFRAWSGAFGDAYDALGNIREIKQSASEDYERKKIFRKFVDRAAGIWITLHIAWEKLSFAQRILITFTQLSIFLVSIYLVRDGKITPGELVAFNAYAAILFGPFVVLGQNWQTIQNGAVVVREAGKILSTPTEIYTPKKIIPSFPLKGNVEFKNVSFHYEKKNNVLSDISFHVRAGETVALVGESGVGKSTIIELLLQFYYPTEGTIIIDGNDSRKFDLKEYRMQIGVVPQEVTLFNGTIEENIKYGNLNVTSKKIETAARLAHATEFIERFPKKYKAVVGWRGIKLSTGQKQRIAIARALLRDPKILILDEPTSALDAKSEKYIQESLNELMKGRTTFVVAHRLSTVRRADQILVFKKGKIVERGKHDELITLPNGIYRHLYDLQIGFVDRESVT